MFLALSPYSSPVPRIHPLYLWMLISLRIAVIWGEIQNKPKTKFFLLKWAVTVFLWLTLDRFSLDDSWHWTGGAPLSEAQRPWEGCHAQAKSLSLGRVAFILRSSKLDKPDRHDLFMVYLPSLINLTHTGQPPRDRHLLWGKLPSTNYKKGEI